MRPLGFCKEWTKLSQPEFTTFRWPRKDRDWQEGEMAQVVIHPRQKGGGKKLGPAIILRKEPKTIGIITEIEAIADGFCSIYEMSGFLGEPDIHRVINKLTIRWVSKH